MKEFKLVKTIQLIIILLLVALILSTLYGNGDLYHAIAQISGARAVFFLGWILFLLSFIFLIYDFSVYAKLKRKYGEMDMAMYSDPLTGIGNRSSLDAFIDSYKNKELPVGVGAITFSLTNMAEINREFGNAEGDRIIKTFSNILADCSKNKAFVGRNGGNNFLALFRDTSEGELQDFIAAIDKEASEFNQRTKGADLTYSYGVGVHTENDSMDVTELVATSYRKSLNRS